MADEQRVDLLATGLAGPNTRLVGYEIGESVCRQYPTDNLLGGGGGGGGSSILTGVGAPTSDAGEVGDFYLDESTGNYYIKTDETTWSLEGSLMGPAGPAGPAGTAGTTWYDAEGPPGPDDWEVGDYYLDTSNGDYYRKTGVATWTLLGNLTGPAGSDGAPGSPGPAGADGATGSTGPQGPAGPSGEAGTPGADGTDGSTWHNGAGAPSSGLGVVGDYYLNSTNGDFYSKTGVSTWTLGGNLKGATGDAGSAGAAGSNGIDGIRTITLQAQSYQPPSSNYATFSTRNQIGVLEFDASTQESARWVFHLPTGRTYGTLTVKVHWCTAAASGDGRWGVRIAKLSGVDIDSDSYDTAVEATTTTSGTAGLVNVTTLSAVGIDSAAAGDLVQLELYRDVGDSADTINSNDLQVLSVQVELP